MSAQMSSQGTAPGAVVKGQETSPARKGHKIVPADQVRWDEQFDVVVVGTGAGGFSAALHASRLGSSVVMLEKAPEIGGTMKKSAAWYWIPNNSLMRAAGVDDNKTDALRYMARLSRPQAYDPNDERFGMTEWEYATMEAFYDNASTAHDILVEMGAIKPIYAPHVPDYHSRLPENTAPYGRTLFPEAPNGEPGKGPEMTRRFLQIARERSIPIRAKHRVGAVVVDADGAVVGVIANNDGQEVAFGARQGVIVASGGFTHNGELRRNFLQAPIFGGCAVLANEGDFVAIATALGTPLWNMNFAWMAPIPLEIVLQGSPYTSGIFAMPGDSMVIVNKYGRRVANEKAIYNELTHVFFQFDPQEVEYPNLLLFLVWDQRTAELWAATETIEDTKPSRLALDNYGNVIYEDFHVIKGETLEDLTQNIRARLEKLAPHTGGFALDEGFGEEVHRTIARFNQLAATGKDLDFQRGENPIELIFNGEARPGNDTGNPTMYPISESGPYYATILAAGTLDTKGGPRTNTSGQVLGADGEPIRGLYGVGNCVASASGQGYWAGGATLGSILTFGYLAAKHAAAQARRELGAELTIA
jgi:succinate dehydrogenase/fumarate reductase flavoprotein subunit